MRELDLYQRPESHQQELCRRLQTATHVMLDVDGTLVNTEPKYFQKLVALTLQDLTVNYSNIGHILSAAHVERLASTLFPGNPLKFFKTFNQHDNLLDRVSATTLFPDAATFLSRAVQTGKKLYLVSHLGPEYLSAIENTVREKITQLIPEAPPIVFEDTISPYSYPNPHEYFKPSPVMFLDLMRKHSLNQEVCIAIGDRLTDTVAALRANVGVAVFLHRGESRGRTLGSYLSVPTFRELLFLTQWSRPS